MKYSAYKEFINEWHLDALNRNYKCTEKSAENAENIIMNCPRKVKALKLGSLLGSGSYGSVYEGTCVIENKEIKVAVKIIRLNYKNALKDMSYEIKMSRYMAAANIGPKVYDAFYTIDNNDNNIINQYIIMEYFESDGYNALRYGSFDITDKVSICEQMYNLYKKTVFKYGMFCSDIKPQNYVIRMEPKGPLVRMIDFGNDFCDFSVPYKRRKIIIEDSILFDTINTVISLFFCIRTS